MSQDPGWPQPAQPPAGVQAPANEGAVHGSAPGRGPSSLPGTRWVPLLSTRMLRLAMVLGVVLGVGGPVTLWFTFKMGDNRPFEDRLGFLFVLIGLGVVLVGLPLVLAEAARLERGSRGDEVPQDTSDASARISGPARGFTAARVVALLGVLIIFAGAYLIRPSEATALESTSPSAESRNDRADRGDRGKNDGKGKNRGGRGGGRGGGNGGGNGNGDDEAPPTTPIPPTTG